MATRKYLTKAEVTSLINAIAVSDSKFKFRDRTLVLMMFRHGLRRSEASHLRWSDISLSEATIYIRRVKGSKSGSHPLQGDELRNLRRLKRETDPHPWVFLSRKKQPLAPRTISEIINKTGILAQFEFPVNAHMLRHATGYYLANKGIDTRTIQAYLGHQSIQNTTIYTELAPNRFNGLWT